MMYFLPDNVKTEALLKSGQQLIQDPSKWCKGAMQKGDSFCINRALFAVGTPNPKMPDIKAMKQHWLNWLIKLPM